jgi:radical SAM superfamily enzyme YgiQ (UPF0313 family)
MSSLGFQLVYSLLNEKENIVCERFFLPGKDGKLLSAESGRPLKDFPFVFISISFEHDYLNIVKILLQGGVEPFTINRDDNIDFSPLVVCGGVASFMNPEPIAPFADVFVIGEAEPVLEDLVDYLVKNYNSKPKKELVLGAAQRFDGIYAPELYTPVYDDNNRCSGVEVHSGAPLRVKRLSLEKCCKAGHSQLLTPAAEFSNLFLTELGRGCSRGCRFCAAGFIYRPPRLWDADAIVEGLAERSVDVSRIGLLGMEMASDDSLDHISSYLMDSGCALSFSSLRADRINDKLLDLLSNSNLKSVAIAPDGASERLRSVINKGLDESDLFNAAVRLVEAGIYKLKLYVMVGLPTETCEDLQELIGLIGKIKSKIDRIGQKRGRLTEIYLSVNCFVPKPWTPFQFHSFGISQKLEPGERRPFKEAVRNLKEKLSYLKSGLKGLANVHFQADKPENVLFQALLSRGDRRLANILFDMASARVPWKSSMKKNKLLPEMFLTSGCDGGSYFPWYIIDHGIDHNYLWHEYMKSFDSAKTEPCDTSICRRCGVCGDR